MLYAHKHDEHEEELMTNLAKMDASVLPFPEKKQLADDNEDDAWMGYDAMNSRIDLEVEGWSRRLA